MNVGRILSALSILVCFTTGEARAIVGPAADGADFTDRVVMVLTRGAEGSGFCTGVVLAPRVILTAAHCLRKNADMLVLYKDGAGKPVTLAVAETAAHPRFREDALRQRVVSIDLGLIAIQTPLPATFHPAALADREPAIGELVTEAGFGIGREGDPRTGGAARAATLRVSEPKSHILLWAEDPDRAGLGGCNGDSGGPLFAADGREVLAVVAWTKGERGRKCGTITQGPLIAPHKAWVAEFLAAH